MFSASPFSPGPSHYACGCCFFKFNAWGYLPQVSLKAHATILSSASRTTLTQTFVNPSDSILDEVSYKFPLYDGVSVVGFKCRVGSRLLRSEVKSKEQANTDYETAVAKDESAAVMDHSDTENDVFTIRLGNVPPEETVTVDITFVGELKQDAEADGIRYTLPNTIAPRYQGSMASRSLDNSTAFRASLQGISITADVVMEKASILRELQSPSHSIKVSLGKTSSTPTTETSFEPSQATATLRLSKDDRPLLERDFVLIVKADGLDSPRALLESHPTIPGQKAVMATLVPRFGLPPAKPEVVFVIDRSASMGAKIPTLKSALKVFLKSLPVGVCFNICSFGSQHSFLWRSSKVYDSSSLQEAMLYIGNINADMGGTEMYPAVEAVTQQRLGNRDLEVLILTDGQIRDQGMFFNLIREHAADNTARFFSLGIGKFTSHSLIEGIARCGNGISQSVIDYEELDRKVVRMLKGALTPHIYDYKLEAHYETESDHDFEVVDGAESTNDSTTEIDDEGPASREQSTNTISLFDDNFTEADPSHKPQTDEEGLFLLAAPKVLQAPHKIPTLYPFIRTTVYLLLDPDASDRVPKSLSFSATSKQGPLCLTIPISDIGKGETIHQLASRKAMIELEEHHGWLQDTSDTNQNSFHQLHDNTKEQVAVRECQKLGIKYQITGKHCSFVALEDGDSTESNQTKEYATHVHYHPRYESSSAGKNKKKKTRGMADSGPMTMDSCEYLPVHALQLSAPSVSKPFGSSRDPGGTFRAMSRHDVPGGLFGATRGASPSTASLFGGASSTPAAGTTSGGFGSARASQSLFGKSASQNPSASNPPPLPGLFGGLGSPNPQTPGPLFGASAPEPTTRLSDSSVIHALVDMQTFEGDWFWKPDLFHLLGLDMTKTNETVNLLLGKPAPMRPDEANVVATLLVMGFLENKHSHSRDLWELVYDKAQGWIHAKLDQMGLDGESMRAHEAEIRALA
ncbi:hypothetical protein N7492_000975 [Penicillium capsulatum]|uniref:von Willebrand domain-containing protein n=1 Tax=Penicillium capsulatum TaxID=69766 RepID=A0A9W9IQK4_9EURO|nr:hypothetical protein N7492_000975 [Penicillium capsulatum]KAJ6129966.1 hypothetical protein N7512_002746 [Penicillium capsulatum]